MPRSIGWCSVSAVIQVFEPGRSRGLTACVIAVHLAAAGGAWLALAGSQGAVLAALALAALVLELWRLRRLPSLYWGSDGDWRCGDPQGPVYTLQGATWSTPWLIVLCLRSPGRALRIPVARDAVDATTWRRLRARLRTDGSGERESP